MKRESDVVQSQRRAEAVASRFGLHATQDSEFLTTWVLVGTHQGARLTLKMGSPAVKASGLFSRSAVQHWLTALFEGPTWMPAGARIRPTTRTVFEWRDGVPGEAPDLTIAGVPYRFLPLTSLKGIEARLRTEIEKLPLLSWADVDDHNVRLRIDHVALSNVDVVDAVQALVDWPAFKIADR